MKEKKQEWKKLKKLVDLVAFGIRLRNKRKKLEAQAEEISKDERALKDFVLETFTANDLTEVKTKAGTARLVTRILPQADTKNDPEAWDKIYKYVEENHAFDILQKRLHEAAVKARWDDKQQIPGVVQFIKKDLKLGDAE